MRKCRSSIIFGAALALWGCGEGPESSSGKHEFSLLDAAAATKLALTSSTIISENNRDYLVIPKPKQNIWIMLKPRCEPYYKQLPGGEYSISKDMFRKVQYSGLASSTVLSCLESHVSENERQKGLGL
jgi:hypothetical protein